MKIVATLTMAAGALLLTSLMAPSPGALASMGPTQESKAKKVKYVGAKLCKNCHNSDETGHAYDLWLKGPHAKAFEALATPKAKEFAKEAGVKDPQKDGKCVQCHVTAYGVDKKLAGKIKPKDGVQCEMCHGPGQTHVTKRMMEAAKGDVDLSKPQKLTEGEIIARPAASTCVACHNEKSPSYKPFCYKERRKLIRHLDPRKKRSEAELKKLEDECYPDCKKCKAEKEKDQKKDK